MATKKQKEELRNMLLQRKEVLLNNIKNSVDSIEALKSQECKDEYDFAEVSSDSFTEGLIATQQLKELKEIEEALKSMDNNTYGICVMCDESIAIGRLKAKPFAKYCIPCREIHEAEIV